VETIGSKRSYALIWCMPNNDDDDDSLHSQDIAGKVASDSDKQILSYRYLKMALKSSQVCFGQL